MSRFKTAHLALLFILGISLVEAESAPASSECFLWKAESGATTVYLLGSLHMCKPELYPLDAAIEAAYGASDTVVVEVDISDPATQLRGAFLGIKMGMYEGLSNVTTELSKESLSKLTTYLESKNMSLMSVQQMKPWFLSMYLTILEVTRLGYQSVGGLDLHFLTKAHKDGKTVLALETIEEQLSLLADEPPQVQELGLMATIDDMPKAGELIGKMTRAWIDGDVAVLQKIFDDSQAEHPELAPLHKKMIDDRNVTMTKKILGYLAGRGQYFVIVGSGHLVGKKGIVGLLEEEGISVIQVKKAAAQAAGL